MVAINRRVWAGSLLASTLLTSSETKRTYAVIGAGVFGAWTAYTLRSAGHNVVLLDQYGPASSRSSSGGESRIIRCAYGPDEVYTRMAKRSLKLWSDFFAQGNRDLLRRIGVLWMAKPDNKYAQQSRETLTKIGVPFRDLSASDLKRDYPQINPEPGAVAILEPESGALMAREAVRAVVEAFVANGGTYRLAAVKTPSGTGKIDSVSTITGEAIKADEYIFACGPWLGKVFPDLLAERIFVTRQEVFFFGIPRADARFSPPAIPVWIDFSDNRGMYGFPDLDTRGFKVAFDLHGPKFDPDTGNRIASAEKIQAVRVYVAQRFPALAASAIVDSRVCQYENTANGDFLIDRHPQLSNVWLIGGGSGHGFKHGPAVGEYAVARITGDRSVPLEPRFSLASKGTHQSRAVY